MQINCSHCGKPIEWDTLKSSGQVECPNCKWNMEVEMVGERDARLKKQNAAGDLEATVKLDGTPASHEDDPGFVIQTLQSNLDRGSISINQFLASKKLKGGIDLSVSAAPPEGGLPDVTDIDRPRRYELGGVVNEGGMGAILNAKDLNLKRRVAMKVLLKPRKASSDDIIRFIEEAQVTSQLEHPNTVPIHELGVDAAGNVFYTMKFVEGITLKDILRRIREGHAATISDYPLGKLLSIFQRVCDAVAFAHSRKVIHRDLKPENVMLGQYGEVQVMDWGIAKVIARKPGQQAEAGTKDHHTVESIRLEDGSEGFVTQHGTLMGTPGFMAPEQINGEIENIDDRTDVYSLGAILYNILTLHPPLTGDNADEIFAKALAGEIPHPSTYNSPADRKPAPGKSGAGTARLPHCPRGQVPDSLAAVAMKALSMNQSDRYQRVKDLQREIDAYLNGFVTSAEHASLAKVVRLFIARHKAVSVTSGIAAAILLVGGIASFIMINDKRIEAESNLAKYVAEQQARKEDRMAAADALVAQARTAIEKRDFARSLKLASSAVLFNPDLPSARMLKAQLLIHSKAYDKASGELTAYLGLATDADFDDKVAAEDLLDLCKDTLKSGSSDATAGRFAAVLFRQKAYVLSADMEKRADRLLDIYRAKLAAVWPGKGIDKQLQLTKDGRLSLDLFNWANSDLTPLLGIPLTSLNLSNCKKLCDLSPLKGMPLVSLDISACENVTDLSPLQGMPLTSLQLGGCTQIKDLAAIRGMSLASLNIAFCEAITDISVLRGMPLTSLRLGNCANISDISPIKDMPLVSLDLSNCFKVDDLSALKGMQLTSLSLCGTAIRDLSPLTNMPLTFLDLDGCSDVRDISPLSGMLISEISLAGSSISSLAPLTSMPIIRMNLAECLNVTDISALRGMPLRSIVLWNTRITDLRPLLECPKLEHIVLPASARRDIEFLRNKVSLNYLGSQSISERLPVAEFWQRFDSQKTSATPEKK